MIQRTERLATLWIPGPMPGLNEVIESAKGHGGSGAAYARLKRQWTDVVWAEALTAKIHKPGPFDRRVMLEFDWVEKDRRRDKDNVASARKFVLDGLVLAKVLNGDGWRWIDGWWDRFSVNPDRPGVGVTIRVPEPTVQM